MKLIEMSEIKFEMKEVEKKRVGTFQKRSIYDPMIDQFIEGGKELVEITVEGKSGAYISHQLKTRIAKRQLDIISSASGGYVYLEKKPTEST